MSMNKPVLEDANLDRIEIGRDGKSVILTFLDMLEGRTCLTLRCDGLVILEYQNAFFAEDGFAVYVGHVGVDQISQEQTKSNLKQMRYQFDSEEASDWQANGQCFLVHVEGGEVLLRVLCQNVITEPSTLL
ncbi:MAG: hypothetical protein NXI04_02040 [Planctomycetaceae bacterium]|nr:hypothetical protein [Planctomycetaceae bacterium]